MDCVCEMDSNTPLLKACYCGCDEIVRILLDARADQWWRANCNSAMLAASACGHLSIVEMLLNHDRGHLEIENSDGGTPLHFAISNEHLEIAHFLLDRGANALATTKVGWTTLIALTHELEYYVLRCITLSLLRHRSSARIDARAQRQHGRCGQKGKNAL